jgi:glutathione synthase/RimK-type ligase-like ATP-grasp enzyme
VGDWRLQKDITEYRPYELPAPVHAACIRLVQQLGLVFGAIDLAVHEGAHYFLEINPTGEWAWLVDQLQLPIAEVIADALCAGSVP